MVDDNTQLLFEAMEFAPEGVVLWDADGRLVMCNKKFRDLHRHVAVKIIPGLRIEELLQQLKSSGMIRVREGKLADWDDDDLALRLRKDELDSMVQYRDKWIRISRNKLANGSVIAFHTDITEIKQSEEALTESEEHFRSIFEDAGVGMAITELNGRFRRVNAALCEMLGYTKEELLGLAVHDVTHPDDMQTTLEAREKFLSDRIKHEAIQKRYIRKDGQMAWGSLTRSGMRNKEGNIQYFVSQVQDITQRRNAEEQLRLREGQLSNSQELINLGYFEHDLNTGINFWSDILCRILGVETGLDRRMEDFFALVHPGDLERVKAAVNNSVVESEDYNMAFRIVRPDGKEKTIHIRVMCIVDNRKTLIKRIGAVLDITEEQHREDQLRQANQAKSNFLTHMSHEFRTPLNSILGFAQVINNDKKNQIDETNHRRIQNILKSGQHLLYLVDDLLDLSRIEAGNISIELKPTNLADVLNDAIDTVETQAKEKNITLSVDLMAEQLILVQSDEGRLKQVFLNLLSNAIKYNRNDGKIFVTNQFQNSKSLRLYIEDTGLGIDSDRLDSIFKPFNRPWTSSPQIPGSGIGLSIAKRLIELMGGNIGVSSKVGVGSTFWIDLKISEGANIDDEIDSTAPIAEQYSIDMGNDRTKQVLYIDDDQSSLELMHEIFEDTSFVNLITSDNAINGLQIALETVPDLVILDINLPVMSGVELLDKLSENHGTENIPAIALSADALPEHVQKGLDCGFSLYLSKPIILNDLRDAVEEILRK